QLRTIINHDNDLEPRGLSFISDHPPLMYSTLIQACLICAALIRSKMANHEIEQITTNGTSDNKRSKPKREINHNNDYSYISDYLQVTNRIFKQMLISSLEGADKIVKR
ncbi:unnamed protein product, partial [Rotaria sp. Silwood1]